MQMSRKSSKRELSIVLDTMIERYEQQQNRNCTAAKHRNLSVLESENPFTDSKDNWFSILTENPTIKSPTKSFSDGLPTSPKVGTFEYSVHSDITSQPRKFYCNTKSFSSLSNETDSLRNELEFANDNLFSSYKACQFQCACKNCSRTRTGKSFEGLKKVNTSHMSPKSILQFKIQEQSEKESQKARKYQEINKALVLPQVKNSMYSSVMDPELLDIENILETNDLKRKKTAAVTVKAVTHRKKPQLQNEKQTIARPQILFCAENVETNKSVCDVSLLSVQERDALKFSIIHAVEVIVTLFYNDKSTQLSDTDTNQNFSNVDSQTVGVLLLVERTNAHTALQNVKKVAYHIKLSKNDDDWMKWTRNFFLQFFAVKTVRKICFDAQEMIKTVIKFFDFCIKDIKDCYILDPRIAAWLLDADNPPVTFCDILEKRGHNEFLGVEILADMQLLTGVMAELSQKLMANNLWDLFFKVETPLIPILASMECYGFHINTDVIKRSGDMLKRELYRLEISAHNVAGHPFLLNSHTQLRQVIFDELKLDQLQPRSAKKIARTSVNNQKSTSEAVLSQLKDFHALPNIILEYRQLQKMNSTYVEGLLQHVDEDNHLFTKWEQASAATGRLSSTKPNVQAIPKIPVFINDLNNNTGSGDCVRYEVNAREPFVSQEGSSFLAADFQQIELRLLAHLSEDPALLKAFNTQDVHDIFIELTSKWLGKSKQEVTKPDREQTKRIVYSVMYGVGKERLADYLKVSPDKAKCVINSFLDSFPGIKSFTKKCIQQCKDKGFTTTIFKRRRLIPNISHPSYFFRAQAERQAVNFCVQGSAADLCKAAMIQVVHALANQPYLKSRLLVQIHDELLLEVPDDELDTVKGRNRNCMLNTVGKYTCLQVSFTELF